MKFVSRNNPISRQYRESTAANGAPPEQVAEAAYRAVLDNQFFVFPTSDLDAMIEVRITEVRQGLAWRDAAGPCHGPSPSVALPSTWAW